MASDVAKFTPEPDLHPLYPEPQCVQRLLIEPGLSSQQKQTLVEHSLLRACTFADLPLLSFLLSDLRPRPYVDLNLRDEDGLSLVSITIVGFGTVTDRHMEREECVRLLIQEGADLDSADYGETTIPLPRSSTLTDPNLSRMDCTTLRCSVGPTFLSGTLDLSWVLTAYTITTEVDSPRCHYGLRTDGRTS
jgi:hypothetical protein